MLEYRTVATGRLNGISIERQLHIKGDEWKTIDRYNTDDISKQPKKCAHWVTEFVRLASQEPMHYILHNPKCAAWQLQGCDCGAVEPYQNTAFGTEAVPEAFAESAHCRLDVIDTDNPTHYDGHMIDAMADCALRIVKKAAAGQ
jgi:hypothetical protein